MLVKASIAATFLIGAALVYHTVDFRELYDEMYPVNGLRRDVLGLCHDAKPTFVRAIKSDREGCYDSMPDSIERAIGWIRTSARLAAMKSPSGADLAERVLADLARRQRLGLLDAQQDGIGDAAVCAEPGKEVAPVAAAKELYPAVSNERLVRELARGDESVLSRLGLKPTKEARAETRHEEKLPVLPLAGSSNGGIKAEAALSAAKPGCKTSI